MLVFTVLLKSVPLSYCSDMQLLYGAQSNLEFIQINTFAWKMQFGL